MILNKSNKNGFLNHIILRLNFMNCRLSCGHVTITRNFMSDLTVAKSINYHHGGIKIIYMLETHVYHLITLQEDEIYTISHVKV